MPHFMAVEQQPIGNDPAMTSPPDGLCAHYRQGLPLGERDKLCKSGLEVGAERVISVVVKAAHSPESVQAFIDIRLFRATSPECSQVPIADLVLGQPLREPVVVELWIAARLWERPHVDQELDPSLSQHVDNRLGQPVGVPDCREAAAHDSSFVSASSLCAAM